MIVPLNPAIARQLALERLTALAHEEAARHQVVNETLLKRGFMATRLRNALLDDTDLELIGLTRSTEWIVEACDVLEALVAESRAVSGGKN